MKVEDLFPSDTRPNVDNPATLKRLDHVEDLRVTRNPGDDRQRWLCTQALQLLWRLATCRHGCPKRM